MQSSLTIKILPRKTKVVGDGAQLHLRHAIRQIGGLPDHGAVRFDQLLGRAEVVVEEVIGAGVGFVLEQGQGLAAQVEVIAQRGAVSQRKRGQRKRGQSPFSCALCLGVNMEKNSPATAAPVSTTGRPLLLILIIAGKKEKSMEKRKNALINIA